MNYYINGPLTATLVVAGTVLNIVTVCIIVRRRFSRQQSNLSEREIIHRHKVTASSNYQSIPAQATVSHKNNASFKGTPQTCPSPRPRIYTYVLWLSCSDTTLLLSAFLMYCVPTLLHGSFGYYAYLFPVYYVMSNAALTASVWLMIALMVDRYRALCSPLTVAINFQKSLPVAHVHRVLAIVSLAAIIFSLPRYFELTLDRDIYSGEVFVRQTTLVDNMVYMIGYRIAGGIVFYSLVPYIVLFALSARIWCVVHKSAREQMKMHVRRRTTTKGRADSEMILLMVMAKFLISRLMPTALDLAEHISGAETFLHSPTATLFVDISNLIVVFSSTTNFFFFLFFSRSFRRIVMASVACEPSPRTRYRLLSVKQHFRWAQNSASATTDSAASPSNPSEPPPPAEIPVLPTTCVTEFLI